DPRRLPSDRPQDANVRTSSRVSRVALSGSAKAKGKALSLSTRTLRCRSEATGRFSQKHHIRGLMPFGGGGDVEALSLLNDDMMPSPSEALLAALGSCMSVSIQANAVARAIPIRRLVIEFEGDIDFAALWGTGDLDFKGLGFET